VLQRVQGGLNHYLYIWINLRGENMSEIEYHLPETLLKIVKKDPDYRIFLLAGKNLIFFPA